MKATKEQRRAKEIYENKCVPESFKELFAEVKKAEEEYKKTLTKKELFIYETMSTMHRNQLLYGVPYEPDFDDIIE